MRLDGLRQVNAIVKLTLAGFLFCAASVSSRASCIPTEDIYEMVGERVALPLGDAIRRGLALDPRVTQSWSEVSARAAGIGVARAAYLPYVDAAVEVSRERDQSTSSALGGNVSGASSAGQWRANMSWLLLDSGSRGARLDRARNRLAVATALRDVRLQQVMFDVARAYYAALEAQSLLDTALKVEGLSWQSAMAACARYEAGAGARGDVLRARTAYDRQVLERLDAWAKLVARKGVLASLVGIDMNMTLDLDSEDANGPEPRDPLAPVEDLLADLRQQHPMLREAYAEILAQEAGRDAIKRAWGPSLTLVGDVSRGTRTGSMTTERARTGASIGIQITIPLYDGGLRKHRTMEADALVDVARAKMRASERNIVSSIWQSHRALRALSLRRVVEVRLHDDATQSYEIARGRYREGVGNIEELISAQSALADAEHAMAASRARWNLAKLTLIANLGQLNIDVIPTKAQRPFQQLEPGVKAPIFPPPPAQESGTDGRRRSKQR